MTATPHVLVLGGGINGTAIARELALQGIGVTLVDTNDLSFGATAYSTRLIHGGLRYLEYGEFGLVRESLGERTRLLRLAPHLVQPIRLFIPVTNRLGGLVVAARRFLHLGTPSTGADARGLWTLEIGLSLYDLYAHDPTLARHARHTRGGAGVPPVAERYRWLASYFDAQVLYPERFVVAQLDDARQAAAETGVPLRVLTRHRARRVGRTVEITAIGDSNQIVDAFEPSAIINATGAWVDDTLRELRVPSSPLMGGTKGSHIVTAHAGLRDALAGQGIYAEANDGRPVFMLPWGDWTLVGTTDLPFSGDPKDSVATEAELEYLITAVNATLPSVGLARSDVDLHYAGVRPLPRVAADSPGAITRRHWMQQHAGCEVPTYSVIGGKLTTCRSLAESAVDALLTTLGRTRLGSTRDRVFPGSEGYPQTSADAERLCSRLADAHALKVGQVTTIWRLMGTRTERLLDEILTDDHSQACLPGTDMLEGLARWVIRHEWVGTLDDLVERRLMLLYDRALTRATLERLATLLVEAGKLAATDVPQAVESTVARLSQHFGRRIS